MSARIPDTLLVSEVLKPTGFDCPEDLEGVSFNEATSGGTSAGLEDNKEVSITENGTIEITPTAGHDYAGMKKVTANVNVAGGADIEANKAATIDVSTYTEPVVIIPTEGKDGMKKATITLSNIPYERTLMYRFFRYRNVGHYIDMNNVYVVISPSGGTVPESYSYDEQDNTLTVGGTVFMRDTSGDLYR